MQHINRLLIKARKAANPLICNALCFINRDYKTDKWICDPRLWDGKPGTGFRNDVIPEDWVYEYDTADEAAEAAKKLFDTLNIKDSEQVMIIVDDLM